MNERERWELLNHAKLSRRLAEGCSDLKSAQALLALAEDYEHRALALQPRAA
jgi:hypothetical protein